MCALVSDRRGIDMSATERKTRDLLDRLGETEHRRRLTADKIFRELRKGERADGPRTIRINPLPKLSPTLR